MKWRCINHDRRRSISSIGGRPVNDIFEIDPETRVITVPASEKLFGVANDGNSERNLSDVQKS